MDLRIYYLACKQYRLSMENKTHSVNSATLCTATAGKENYSFVQVFKADKIN